jgi:microcin C transport system substrate-binding protein
MGARSDEELRICKAHAVQRFIQDDATYLPLFEVPYDRLAFWTWLRFPTSSGQKTTDGLSYFDAECGRLIWIDPKLKTAVLDARKQGQRIEHPTRNDETLCLKG